MQDCNTAGRFAVTGSNGDGFPIVDAVSRAYATGLRIFFPEFGQRALMYCPGCGSRLTFYTAPAQSKLTVEYIEGFTLRHARHVRRPRES